MPYFFVDGYPYPVCTIGHDTGSFFYPTGLNGDRFVYGGEPLVETLEKPLSEWYPYLVELGIDVENRQKYNYCSNALKVSVVRKLTDLGLKGPLCVYVNHSDFGHSEKFPGQVKVFKDGKNKRRGLHTAMKPGRAIKFLFPHITDVQLEKFVNWFRDEYLILEYTVKSGVDASDFKHAYSHDQSPTQNLDTTSKRKSLANSCMRHDFSHLPHHPAEAYASGDFKIVWAEDASGRIAGRCVVYLNLEGTPEAGPVYGTSEAAINLIEKSLPELVGGVSFGKYGNIDWDGARLESLPHGGGYIAPYLDCGTQNLKVSGNYLIIDDSGNIDASTYDGVLREGHRHCCEGCGDGVDENDVRWDPEGYYCYCEDCFNERYRYCNYTDQDAEAEGGDYAYFTAYGRNHYSWVCESALHDDFFMCSESDEYWHMDYLVTTSDGYDVSSERLDGNYFYSEEENEYHPISIQAELDDGRLVSIEYATEACYALGADGVWHKEEEEAA